MVKNARSVNQYTKDDKFVKCYETVALASIEMGVRTDTIWKAIQKKTCVKSHYWVFTEDTDLPNEEWCKHPTYDIKCSNKGRVQYKTGRKTYGTLRADGYRAACIKRVKLYDSGRKYGPALVHRLIAETFLDNVKEQVNHIDRNKSNNSLNNLEWVTASENSIHAKATVKHNHPK